MATSAMKTPTPIDRKSGIGLIRRLELITHAIEAEVIGDAGPLRSSPTQRRKMALTLRGLAADFAAIADRIDPLRETAGAEDTTSTAPAAA